MRRALATGVRAAWRAGVPALLWLVAQGALAQSLESVLRPGDVVTAHAKWEDDCAACHVRFDRNAQDGRCTACHKDVGADVRERRGFHGRLDPQPCRTCHTDHKGRAARIVELDTKTFDHARTDYALHGRHAGVACASCHVAGRKWRDAPQACVACHRQDDKHRGSLGSDCANCHGEADWKRTTFDHARTRFPLRGGHADARCDACHTDSDWRRLKRQAGAATRPQETSR